MPQLSFFWTCVSLVRLCVNRFTEFILVATIVHFVKEGAVPIGYVRDGINLEV